MSDDNILHFSFTFSLDRDEFFRRTCSNCGRDFKTKVDPDVMISTAFRRIEDEIGRVSLSTYRVTSNLFREKNQRVHNYES